MLQEAGAAATRDKIRGKIPLNRHRKRVAASRARRRIEVADEPDDGNGAAVVLVTFIEAERMLKLSRQTLHNMISAGTLRVRRFGRAVRIPISEIKRLGAPGVTVTRKLKTATTHQQAAE